MKAWEFSSVGSPLKLVELPDPEPGPGEVIVDVMAAGLCHTDVGIMDGTLTEMIGFTPIVLGHEAAGVVSAIGAGVTTVAVGDRVAVSASGDGQSGVVGQALIGTGRNGGYADKTVSPVGELITIPDNVPFHQAAAATDAGMTSYYAIFNRGGLRPGTKIGIIGLGGLGMTAARLALLGGGDVYAAEINRSVHAIALGHGVKQVVDDVKELAAFELDLIVDFAGFGTTTAGAIEVINRGGRVVQVGVGLPDSTINTYLLVVKEVELIGSCGGTPADTQQVINYIASGDLEIATRTIGFDDIPTGLEQLARGEVPGARLVAVR